MCAWAWNVKHKLQIRTLSQTHVDSEYCKVIFTYFKGMITELADVVHKTNPGMIVRYISMDDKSKVITDALFRYCLYIFSYCVQRV